MCCHLCHAAWLCVAVLLGSLTTCPLLQVQEKLLLSACHLLVSLATTVRPVFLISIPAVQKVFNRITDTSAQRLPDKVIFVWSVKKCSRCPWDALPQLLLWSITYSGEGGKERVGDSSSVCCVYPGISDSLSTVICFKQQHKEKTNTVATLRSCSVLVCRDSPWLHCLFILACWFWRMERVFCETC